MSSIIRSPSSHASHKRIGTTPNASDVSNISQACFNGVLKLRHPQSLDEINCIYNDLRTHLDALTKAPEAFGLEVQTAHDVAYAVAAFADETAAKSRGFLADFWLPRSLQFLYFSDNTAGEGFYRRLDAVRQDPDRRAALHTYYVALALGFEGRYGLSGGAQAITTLMGSLHQALVASATLQGNHLSAHALPPEAPGTKTARSHQVWILGAAVAVGLTVGLGVMHIVLQQAVSAVVHATDTLFCQGLR